MPPGPLYTKTNENKHYFSKFVVATAPQDCFMGLDLFSNTDKVIRLRLVLVSKASH